MTFDWFKRQFPTIQMNAEQEAACRFLEREGLKFCVDFGYENAAEMAWRRFDDMYCQTIQ